MFAEEIFEKLWLQYSGENPDVGRIYKLFIDAGEWVINDHVAFRTFNDPRISIDIIAKPFLSTGYKEMGTYHFTQKKLNARHYEMPGDPEAPRVFISEMLLERFSDELQRIIRSEIDRIPENLLNSEELILQGSLFRPLNYATYETLRKESEYAAWVYAHGYRANHFTVSVNHLQTFDTPEKVNTFLKSKGFKLNDSGGEIKGSPLQLLEQSSTLADQVTVPFMEGDQVIPGCYYEFAMRYPDKNGRLFSGFIAGSADKIFESTDFRKQ